MSLVFRYKCNISLVSLLVTDLLFMTSYCLDVFVFVFFLFFEPIIMQLFVRQLLQGGFWYTF